MKYDLSNGLDVQSARARLEHLIKKGAFIDLTEKSGGRSLQANAYLHVILGYFALQVGETLEFVKRRYYKIHCNPDLFIREKEDKVLGERIRYLRSSADLTKDEFSLSIERFRNWSAQQGWYLPSSEEHAYLMQAEREVEIHKAYL